MISMIRGKNDGDGGALVVMAAGVTMMIRG
jgi:hypothetical protein